MASRETDSLENKRIDSWKEIAAFFGKDERTVKRWEKERALPIHRMPGGRGSVFAYTAELTGWLHSTYATKVTDEPLEGNIEVTDHEVTPPAIYVAIEPPSAAEISPVTTPVEELAQASTGSSRRIRGWIAGSIVLVVVVLLLVRVLNHSAHGKSIAAGKAHRVPSPEAQELYLRGRYYWNRRTGDSLKEAIDAYSQAIEREPDYAAAYAGLAQCYDLLREYSNMPPAESYPRAISAATKAIQLDDTLPEAHAALAFALFFWSWEVPRALDEYRRAIQLNPNDVEAHHWYATSLLSLERYQDALREINTAQALNPTSPSIVADRALILYWAGETQRGLGTLEEMERAEPDFLSPHRYLANIFFGIGNFEGFIDETRHSGELSHNEEEIALGDAADRGWQQRGARGMFESMMAAQQSYFDAGKSSGFLLATTCAHLGRKKDAVHYLEAAYRAHDVYLFGLAGSYLEQQLKGDPEFIELEKQIRDRIEG
jgi:tetratricopeptide (TPR) repeat protein